MTRKDDKAANRLGVAAPGKRGIEKRRQNEKANSTKVFKERVTFQLPIDLIEKARDVVYFTPGLTMAHMMEDALIAQLQWMEKTRGRPFPSRAGATLKTGRPLKAARRE